MNNQIKFYLENYKFWLVVFVLVLTAFLVYSPHWNYNYPLHADEWHHIQEANSLLNGKYELNSVSAFEIGYHVFLACLNLIGIDLVLAYKFLPVVFAIFASSALFIFCFYLTKSFWSSLFSMIFFASLPSDVNLLGLWFAVPLTFSIFLVILSFLFFYKGIDEDKKFLLIFCIIFFILAFVHAISAFFVFIISFLFLLGRYKKGKIDKAKLKILSVIPLILIAAAIIFVIFSGKNISWFLSQLMFSEKWSLINMGVDTNPLIFNFFSVNFFVSQYFLPVLFGIFPFLLALIGLYFSLKKEKCVLISIWMSYCIFISFIFVNFKISPFVSYQRGLYYSLIALCILAGIGLVECIKLIKNKLENNKIIAFCLIIALLFLSFFLVFYHYGEQRKGTELYYLINLQEYNNLVQLGKIANNRIILAPIDISTAIPAITNNNVLSTIYFTGNDKIRDEIKQFFYSGCLYKKDFLKNHSVDYIYSEDKIDCGFKEVYSGGFFVYSS